MSTENSLDKVEKRPVTRVLILKLSSFGDILQTFYALEDLCRFNPSVQIFWCVESQFEHLLRISRRKIRIISLPLSRWKKDWYRVATIVAILKTVRALRSENIDVSVDLQGMLKSSVFGFLSGAKIRFGPSRKFSSERGACYFYNRKKPIQKLEGLASRTREFLGSALGYDYQHFTMSSGLSVWSGGAEIALFVGASTERKSLSGSELLDISLRLRCCTSAPVVLYWGNETERRKGLNLLKDIKTEQFRVAERVYSVAELMSRLSKETAFVIGADTGPVHFAVALGVPTIMLFKSTRLERYSHPDLKVLYPLLISSEFDLGHVSNAIANLVESHSQVKS